MKTLFYQIIISILSFVAYSQSFKLRDSIVHVGDICTITHLNIGYDGDRLSDDTKLTLDSIALFLKKNPSVELELGSYSDLRGNEENNLAISKTTATYFVNYLLENGVNNKQLVAKGYGESQPLKSDEEINKYRLTDKGEYSRLHILNKRIVLKVIKIGS